MASSFNFYNICPLLVYMGKSVNFIGSVRKIDPHRLETRILTGEIGIARFIFLTFYEIELPISSLTAIIRLCHFL